MIFGVGTSSTSRFPPRVEIFFDGLNRLSFPAASAREHFAEGKIAHRRRVKNRVHFFPGKRFQFRPQIRRRGKNFHRCALRSPG